MRGGDWAFAVLAINPIGGLLVALPFAILKLGYPAWLALLVGVPLAYVQVLVVDLGWSLLSRWPWWLAFLQRRRSPRVERLLAARGSFWPTLLLAPMIGPWLVMAFMRYAQIPQRRVALPIFLGLCLGGTLLAGCCLLAPRLFHL